MQPLNVYRLLYTQVLLKLIKCIYLETSLDVFSFHTCWNTQTYQSFTHLTQTVFFNENKFIRIFINCRGSAGSQTGRYWNNWARLTVSQVTHPEKKAPYSKFTLSRIFLICSCLIDYGKATDLLDAVTRKILQHLAKITRNMFGWVKVRLSVLRTQY